MKKVLTLIMFTLACLQLNAKSVINTNSSWIIFDDIITGEQGERSTNSSWIIFDDIITGKQGERSTNSSWIIFDDIITGKQGERSQIR